MARRRRRSAAMMLSGLEAQAAMWSVLGVRVPLLFTGRMAPDEQVRMVAEKVEAFAESQVAAAMALGRAMTKPMRRPADVLAAGQAVTAAALRPYHRKVKSNAKRLKAVREKD